MPFVNEYMPIEDIKKYDIESIDRRFNRVTFRPDWTIDRDKDVYLRLVASGREEFSSQKDFTLFWKGFLIVARLDEAGGGARGGEGWSAYKLLRLDLPNELLGKRGQIISDLKEALIAYKGDGVCSTRTTSKTSFDF